MKIAIVGSRSCGNITVNEIIEKIPSNCTAIVSGGAKGIDTLAKEAAQKLNIPIEEILPEYKKFGKKAPLVRNQEIIEKADEILAFWDFKSRGTKNAILQALRKNKKVQIFLFETNL